MAKFKKGNKAAKGKGPKQAVRRGRPPVDVTRALLDLILEKGDDGKSMRELAVSVWRAALQATDEDGNPTPQAIGVATKITEYVDGPPKQGEQSGKLEIEYSYAGEETKGGSK